MVSGEQYKKPLGLKLRQRSRKLELEYAGVFTLAIPEEHLQPVLLIECPRLLFPFARNILADVSRDGGFPPLMLGPLDFAAMYQAKMQELEKTTAAGDEAPDQAN